MFFGPRFLPQTPWVLMYINCMVVTKTKCLVAMYKISKNENFKNFELLIKHSPHWINFIILLS